MARAKGDSYMECAIYAEHGACSCSTGVPGNVCPLTERANLDGLAENLLHENVHRIHGTHTCDPSGRPLSTYTCEYHQGYEDGIDAALVALSEAGYSVVRLEQVGWLDISPLPMRHQHTPGEACQWAPCLPIYVDRQNADEGRAASDSPALSVPPPVTEGPDQGNGGLVAKRAGHGR